MTDLERDKMIDYKAEIAKAKKQFSKNKIEAIVLGPSGSGKSALGGTFSGKTLYLYGSAENHGPKSAMTYGGQEVDPICIDKDRTPDDAIKLLLDILGDSAFLKGYAAIVIDSATVLEDIIRNTKEFKLSCLSAKGQHNTFAEGPAMLTIFNKIMTLLRDSDKDYLVTCILDVQSLDSDSGEIMESKPRLSTYAVAEGLIQQFPDVLVIGPMTKGDKCAHRLQFSAGVKRNSTDESGSIKKTINFRPRITGAKTLPASCAASMEEVRKLKEVKV